MRVHVISRRDVLRCVADDLRVFAHRLTLRNRHCRDLMTRRDQRSCRDALNFGIGGKRTGCSHNIVGGIKAHTVHRILFLSQLACNSHALKRVGTA